MFGTILVTIEGSSFRVSPGSNTLGRGSDQTGKALYTGVQVPLPENGAGSEQLAERRSNGDTDLTNFSTPVVGGLQKTLDLQDEELPED